MSKSSWKMAVLATAIVAATIGQGAAQAHHEARANTFSGDCRFSGQVKFDPPLTNEPQAVNQTALATGECSGEFVDRKGRTHDLSNAPVTFTEVSHAEDASCLGGTATGNAKLRFPYGKIRAGFEEIRPAGSALITLTGAKAGSATGVANVSSSEDPLDIAQRCGTTGLAEVRIEAEATTTPSISG
jgi:hypothetical protein